MATSKLIITQISQSMQELSSKILTGYNGVVKYFICVKCNKKKTLPEKHLFSKWKDIIKYQCDKCYKK